MPSHLPADDYEDQSSVVFHTLTNWDSVQELEPDAHPSQLGLDDVTEIVLRSLDRETAMGILITICAKLNALLLASPEVRKAAYIPSAVSGSGRATRWSWDFR